MKVDGIATRVVGKVIDVFVFVAKRAKSRKINGGSRSRTDDEDKDDDDARQCLL